MPTFLQNKNVWLGIVVVLLAVILLFALITQTKELIVSAGLLLSGLLGLQAQRRASAGGEALKTALKQADELKALPPKAEKEARDKVASLSKEEKLRRGRELLQHIADEKNNEEI